MSKPLNLRRRKKSQFGGYYIYTPPENTVFIARAGAASFNPALVAPDYVPEVVRLLQDEYEKRHDRTIFKVKDANQPIKDRWGKNWSPESILNLLIESTEDTDEWRNTLRRLHMTYGFANTAPKKTGTVRENRRSHYCYINTYCYDRHYGGPAEGGDYYNAETPVESIRVKRKNAARLLREKQRECDIENEGAPSIYSVLSRGIMVVRQENFRGLDVRRQPYRYE